MRFHRPLTAAAAALLCCAALPGQATDYHFDIDQTGPPVAWELILNLGDVTEQPPLINFDGDLVMELDSPIAPFSSGKLHGSLIRALPQTVTGVIDNPIPGFPPLGTFTVTKLQAEIHSIGPFAINGNGDFVANAAMTTSAGKVTLAGIFGSGSASIAGMFQISPSISIQGNISQSGSDLDLHIDLNVLLPMITPSQTITGSIALNGPIDAKASTTQANPMSVIVPYPLPAGASTIIEVRDATPTVPVFLAASTSGLGSFNAGSLGVILSLDSPFQVGNPLNATLAGNAFFQVFVPPSLVGTSVWIQAAQIGDVTNVAGTWVD